MRRLSERKARMSALIECWIWRFLMATLAIFIGLAKGTDFDGLVVDTEAGKLKGSTLKSAKGRTIFAFQGIPYAKPPVKSLRFMPPQPVEMWSEVKNATQEGNQCPQLDFFTREYIGDEDCLFLNVYTPKIATKETKIKLPVMVWIHGGLFLGGSGGTDMHGPEYLLDEDIILVTINYRIGVLGFLSIGDKLCPGNNGLKDQVMALKWVKTNIGAFGGDPIRVTIFGNSAGGASVHYHILSPLSKGLFQRAISQSGSALNPWAFTKEGPKHAHHLASLLGCEYEGDNVKLIECLRYHSAERFVLAITRMKDWGTEFFNPFVPVAEGKGKDSFLCDDPLKMMKSGKINKVKYMLGLNADEGIITSLLLLKDPALNDDMVYEMYNYLPKYLGYSGELEKAEEITAKIHDFYFQNETLTSSLYNKFFEMDMDHKMLYGTFTTAKTLSQSSFPKIYFYVLSYDGEMNTFGSQLGTEFKGVYHVDEIPYLFKSKAIPNEIKPGSHQEKTLVRIVKMWTNFAKEGNPTPEVTDELTTIWEPFDMKTKNHLDIGLELKMKTGLYDERMEFWESINAILQRKGRPRDEL